MSSIQGNSSAFDDSDSESNYEPKDINAPSSSGHSSGPSSVHSSFWDSSLSARPAADEIKECPDDEMSEGLMVEYSESEIVGQTPLESPTSGTDEVEEMVIGVRERNPFAFADKLLRTMPSDDEASSFCSPICIQLARTICMFGARGMSFKEMLRVIAPDISVKDITIDTAMKTASNLMALGQYYSTSPSVSIANKLWVEDDLETLHCYTTAAGVDAVGSFNKYDGQKSADSVNRWFARNTNDMVTEMVEIWTMQSDLVITNTIHFSGKLAAPFLLDDTEENVPFYGDRMVTMMYSCGIRFFAQNVSGKWDVVKLPFSDSSVSLFLVIRSHGNDRSKLKISDLVDTGKCPLSEGECILWVPAFTLDGDVNLNAMLSEVEMMAAFGGAEYSGIDRSGTLMTDEVVYKGTIGMDVEMNEDEIEEPPTPTAMVEDEQGPTVPVMRFDRPFAFHIIDEAKQLVLFSGRFEGK